MCRLAGIALFLMLFVGLVVPVQTFAQGRCALPEGYLDEVTADVEAYGAAMTALDTENVLALADFFVELIGARGRYTDMTANLPECGLRLHIYFLALVGNMQDRVGLAIALHADPDRVDYYLEEIEQINARLVTLVELVEYEIELLQRLPPLAIRYIAVEAVNVRAGPGPDHESLGILEEGDRIEVITIDLDERGNAWYEFYYKDDTGWVLGELTSEFP